jgi:transglutaminase-like putative cysteine protease
VESSYSIGDLAQTYLPLPYPTDKVQIEGTWLWDPDTLNAVGEGVTTQGLDYRVSHLDVKPTREQLDTAPQPPEGIVERYTELPDDLPEEIRQIARRQAGTGTDYEKALRLQNWLRSEGGFQYSEQVTRGSSGRDSSQDAVLAFLTDERRGYCVQFASAMAVMARAEGIPARVAVGFLPGSRQQDGSWAISVRDAHAWPELYFQNVGWVRFEPTPATRASQAPEWARPAPDDPTQATPTPSASASVSPSDSSSLPESETRGADITETDESLVSRVWAAVPWRVVGLLALALLLLATPIAAAALARRNRWRRADTRALRAEAAWDELRDRLADLGVGWAVSWTPRALQQRLGDEHRLDGAERAALGRLANELETARYAPPNAGGLSVEELRSDVRLVVDGVAAARPAAARRRARWLPNSGISAMTSTARRVDAATDEARRRAANRAVELGSEVRRTVSSGGRRR